MYDQAFDPARIPFKPNGLWLSDENGDCGWKSWCENSDFGLDRLRYKTDFKCNITTWKVLRNLDEAAEFDRQYCTHEYCKGVRPTINWIQVAREYGGILITPYIRNHLRMEFMWYYTWDCASACVWDLSTVEKIHG